MYSRSIPTGTREDLPSGIRRRCKRAATEIRGWGRPLAMVSYRRGGVCGRRSAQQPAYGAADDDVGREVLAGQDARHAHAGGKSVGGELGLIPGYSEAMTVAEENAMMLWAEGKEESSPALL